MIFKKRVMLPLLLVEFRFRPVIPRIFMVRQAGNAPCPHPECEIRAVSFTVKDQGEPGKKSLFSQCKQTGLVWDFLFQAGNDLLFQHREQARINGLVDHEKRLPVHGVHPVVRGGPQAEFLTGNIMAGQLRLAAIVHPDMAIHIQHAGGLREHFHPVPAQLASPLGGLTIFR